MQKTIYVFLPPGIQRQLWERFGRIPRELCAGAAKKIEALWKQRNMCPEEEVEQIDQAMFTTMLRSLTAARTNQPRLITESYNLHGAGAKRCRVYIMPVRSKLDYWASVTNVRCPCCPTGRIRWHEAGYVPGYRICDGCRRTFLARGNAKMPKLILDRRN